MPLCVSVDDLSHDTSEEEGPLSMLTACSRPTLLGVASALPFSSSDSSCIGSSLGAEAGSSNKTAHEVKRSPAG